MSNEPQVVFRLSEDDRRGVRCADRLHILMRLAIRDWSLITGKGGYKKGGGGGT